MGLGDQPWGRVLSPAWLEPALIDAPLPQPSPLQLDLQPQAKVLMSVQYFLEDVGKTLPGLGT